MGSGVSFDAGLAGDDKAKKDPRKRNSLAFNIVKFIEWEEDEYGALVDDIRTYKAEQNAGKKDKITKFSRMAENVLRGNNRELKFQVVNFQSINRKYPNQHNDGTLLHFICSEGYDAMFEFLINPRNHAESDNIRVDIDARDNRNRTPLMLCFIPPTASFLGLMFGVDEEGTPLNERPDGIESVNDWIKPGGPKSREICVKYCIKMGADVTARDYHDFTCLHYAAMWGWASTCKMLLNAGADVNCTNLTGKTPIMFAVEQCHTTCVRFLANIEDNELNAVDADGQSALLMAMELGEDGLEIIEILVEAGADVNVMNHKKKTPLHIACLKQSQKQVLMLLALNCQRRDSAFNLLEGAARELIVGKLDEEDRQAKEELDRLEHARKKNAEEGAETKNDWGYKNKSPYGQWVEYVDKRDSSMFYYNRVSRKSQKDKPKDFIKDKKRIIKESTFGHAFYH